MSINVDEQAVREVIESRSITTLFQPVVSIPAKSVVGLEAYSRGGDGKTCDLAPSMLFHKDLSVELKLDVDKLCREKAFKRFKPIHDAHTAMLLYVNADPNTLDAVNPDTLAIPKQAREIAISQECIVIESLLRDSIKEKALILSNLAKEAGFCIGLDNCSVDDAFSHAIALTKPHFVKINRTFFAEEHRKTNTSEILDILIKTAHREGAAVVAMGVESEEESIRLLTAGVHLQQGYYYTRGDGSSNNTAAFYEKINNAYDNFRRIKRELIRKKRGRVDTVLKTLSSVCHKLSNISEAMFETTCRNLVGEGTKIGDVISIFVLNKNGEQITPHCHIRSKHGCLGSTAVLGSIKGADHSMRDYAQSLDIGYDYYFSSPFRSPFSGGEVCTISKRFYNYEGGTYTVCIEVPHPG